MILVLGLLSTSVGRCSRLLFHSLFNWKESKFVQSFLKRPWFCDHGYQFVDNRLMKGFQEGFVLNFINEDTINEFDIIIYF